MKAQSGPSSAGLGIMLLLTPCNGVRMPVWATERMTLSPSKAAEAVKQLQAPGSLILIDANNVRGLVGFRWSKVHLASLVGRFARQHGLSQRVVIVWDHASVAQAFHWDEAAHLFAGPRRSADDVLATDVLHASQGLCEDVWIATADRELVWRSKTFAQASEGRLRVRVLSTCRLVGLLLLADREDAAARAREELAPLPDRFERSARALGHFLASQRKRRRHEHLRRARRRPDGYSAPHAEKTWQRVVLAEALRRLLHARAGADGSHGQTDGFAARLVHSYNDAHGAGAAGGVEAVPSAASRLLNDVRLDRKGRNWLLRYGAALSEGELDGVADGDASTPPTDRSAEPRSPRAPPTRRERRLARILAAPQSKGAGRSAECERETQLAALDSWLTSVDS